MKSSESIELATAGFDHLLNNRIDDAQEHFLADGSAFHQVGYGLSFFLLAALGQEDKDLKRAMELLFKVEEASNRAPKEDSDCIYPNQSEYTILIADAAICQAIIHILTESYVEFVRAVGKLNKSYKLFNTLYRTVYPGGLDTEHTFAQIIDRLNETYDDYKAGRTPTVADTPSGIFGWARSRSSSGTSKTRKEPSASLQPKERRKSLAQSASFAEPHWSNDPAAALVISGASFGFGLFMLLFSTLPPRFRKVISWFGFSSMPRESALKLLTVSALAGNDVHASFASLSLVTYYTLILLMSGWQMDKEHLLTESDIILTNVEKKYPDGVLWVLNRAKLWRMKKNTDKAIAILENHLENNTQFAQADALIVFELGWCYLSRGLFLQCADTFQHMQEINAWSHATYVFVAMGAYISAHQQILRGKSPELTEYGRSHIRALSKDEVAAQIDALWNEIPQHVGKKRFMGEPPATEAFIQRKITAYNKKHARWVAAKRIPKSAPVWHVIRIGPAAELGLFWNSNGHTTANEVQAEIEYLAALTPAADLSKREAFAQPAPRARSRSASASSRPLPDTDLDSVDEIAVRNLLLGDALIAAGDFDSARAHLEAAIALVPSLVDDIWVLPIAYFDMAVLLCHAADRDGDWSRLDLAEKYLTLLYDAPEYSMKSRTESRAGMLREEIAAKREDLKVCA